jgi:hypothetical protein
MDNPETLGTQLTKCNKKHNTTHQTKKTDEQHESHQKQGVNQGACLSYNTHQKNNLMLLSLVDNLRCSPHMKAIIVYYTTVNEKYNAKWYRNMTHYT